MIDVNKLTDMVVDLKLIESSDSYMEVYNKSKAIYELYFGKNLLNDDNFLEKRKEICKTIETRILSYLKEVI